MAFWKFSPCRHDLSTTTWTVKPGACRSKACAACGEKPTITSMEASREFATKHSLTVARVAPETADVPTTTCQVCWCPFLFLIFRQPDKVAHGCFPYGCSPSI